jgi:hypothetical protein
MFFLESRLVGFMILKLGCIHRSIHCQHEIQKKDAAEDEAEEAIIVELLAGSRTKKPSL